MPIPLLIPLIAAGAAAAAGAGANLYSQHKQRELYQYQKNAYERQYRDWSKNVPNRTIRYPELSYPGHIKQMDTGISQSYASSVGSVSRFTGQLAGGTLYRRNHARSLFNQHVGRSSRYL